MVVKRPAHLTRLYSEYAKRRASFALELANIFRLRSQIESWSKASVLDIGCGDGQMAQAFADLGAAVTGIEYSVDRVMAISGASVAFRLIGGDGHHLPFQASSFMFIILADVLEHVTDPDRVMQEVARVARPGALVYVGATNRTSVANLLADPHYNAPLIPLMSKRVATWYVTRLLRLSDSFNVEKYFFRKKLLKCLQGPGFSCEALPYYREKIRTSHFAIAPGRSLVRRILALPGIRPLVLSVADTAAFEYCVAPGFHFLCRRNQGDSAHGQGTLVCSGCHGTLVKGSMGLTCRECGRSFEVRQGIPLMHLPIQTKREADTAQPC